MCPSEFSNTVKTPLCMCNEGLDGLWQAVSWKCDADMEIMFIQKTYGEDQGLKWMVYWRLFYLACSELFNYNGGEEWFVSHYLFKKR